MPPLTEINDVADALARVPALRTAINMAALAIGDKVHCAPIHPVADDAQDRLDAAATQLRAAFNRQSAGGAS